MYRIIKVKDKYQVQKNSFFFFWFNCYVYQEDYRKLALYDSKEAAQQYFKLKPFLEI